MDSPCRLVNRKAGTSGQPGRRFDLARHSLCYRSGPAQACSTAFEALSIASFPVPYFAGRSPAVNSSLLAFHPQSDRLRVVLVNPRNPLNIGAAARAMSNFGFHHLCVVNPYDLAFREARSAVGASPILASTEVFERVAEAVADCTLVIGTTAVGRRELQHPVKRLEQGARLIRKRLVASRVALLFGSEKRGLSNEDLSHCQWLLRIPTREEHRSMNLGQAVAVCLYELARDPQIALQPEKRGAATAAELERITSALLDALLASGYLQSLPTAALRRRSAAPADEKIRRLIRRLNLSSADADLTLGILRQILWKSRSDNKLSH